MISLKNSVACFARAKKRLVGGVNSPVRAFKSVGGTPVFIERGAGARLFDVDGNRYVDYCLSWGALILGHAHPAAVRAIRKQASRGTTFGAATRAETELAEFLAVFYPACENFRFTSSGTEAVMTALRVARGATGRSRIIKFEGGYHGHFDALLAKSGSGLATLGLAAARPTIASRGLPASAGVPRAVTDGTCVLPYNDIPAVERAFRRFDDIAAVIVEPIAGNMGVVPATPDFLRALRRRTKKRGAVLIFDEVITGFRVAPGGAQSLYGIEPDLTTLGKIIGGGLPVGALGGPRRLMKHLAPEGPVYQAGTLSGNPLAMAAGLATLRQLAVKGFFASLSRRTADFVARLGEALSASGLPVQAQATGAMFSLFFCEKPPTAFHQIPEAHAARYKKFFRHMLEAGIYLPPSPTEAFFTSAAHRPSDFEAALKAAARFRSRPF